MAETVVPPPEEVAAESPDVQHPTGLFYLDEDRGDPTVVRVVGGTVDDPSIMMFGYEILTSLSACAPGARILGPVVMPARDDDNKTADPTTLIQGLVQAAYVSGRSAGLMGLPADLQKTVQGHHTAGVVDALLRTVAAGKLPRTEREEDVYEVVDELVEKVLAAEHRADADQLRDAAMYKLRDVLDKPNPHHPDQSKCTYGREDYESWVHENDKLRRVVFWCAQQIADPKLRRELAAQVRAASVQDQAEEDEIQVLDFRKAVDVACDLLDAAVDCHVQETADPEFGKRPRGLPPYWNGKATHAASKLRELCCDLPEVRTLARVRFA